MNNNQTMWNSLPSFFGTLATVSLILSVTYDWGYLYWLGLSFSEVPTSLSDHARSALVWAPSIGIILFILLVLELVNRRVEQGMTEQEIIATVKNPKLIRIIRESPYILGEVAAAVVFVRYLLWASVPFEIFSLSAIICWWIFVRWLFSHKRIQERTSMIYRQAIAFIPALLLYFAYVGMSAAKADVTKIDTETFRTIQLTEAKSIEAKILRSFEKAVLLWEPVEKKIRIISWSEIDSISYSHREHVFTGLFGENNNEKEKNQKGPKMEH